MTVLMFGWEFPPHISGGLGTACFGLSQALLQQRVNLLFVVPKAYGDETIPLINASAVIVGEETLTLPLCTTEEFHGSKRIMVESGLKPYSTTETFETIEEWNYQFVLESNQAIKRKEGVRYNFTGKYGPSLLDEVTKYAEVAGVIAAQNEFDLIHAHDWLTYL
ncbi:MAG TPA: glycogen/starch synthase, partial [Chryseosolibacter sp.]